MQTIEPRPEPDDSLPPPLEPIWGLTGLLYVVTTIVCGAAGAFAAYFLWHGNKMQETTAIHAFVLNGMKWGAFFGIATATAQWLVLRGFVRRALLAVMRRRELDAAGMRLVGGTAWWIVATATTYVLGAALSGLLNGFAITSHQHWLMSFPFQVLAGAISGYLLGKAQWLVIRRHVPDARRWTRWTVGAMALLSAANSLSSFLLFSVVGRAMPSAIEMLVFVQMALAIILYGLCLGGLQAVCMRKLARGWIARVHVTTRRAPTDAGSQ